MLQFESAKTYYIATMSDSYLFSLNNAEGVTIDGGGSKFLLGTTGSYLSVTATRNCTFQNAVFDYATKPAFTAEMVDQNAVQLAHDQAQGRALMRADRDIGLADGETYTPSISWFGVINATDARRHMYIEKYEMVSQADRTFYIYFTSDSNTRAWLKDGSLKNNGMICPMTGWGHMLERGFTIARNTDFVMRNVTIHSCSKFGMYIGLNEGSLTMDNVDFVPSDEMNFTTWRDAFHVKDNRCAITWKDCDASGNYDDIFNISSSALYVDYYNAAARYLVLVWPERNNGVYYEILPGDTLSVIDTATGYDCGTVEIESVISQGGGKNVVTLKTPLVNFTSAGTTTLAYFTNRCAPGSQIVNCNFNGTFRFRGPIEITGCTINNMRTWIDIEGMVEGPVPKNVVFRDCTIQSNSYSSFEIGVGNTNTDETAYHIENILFERCVLDVNTLHISENEQAYVILRDCVAPDGSAIPDKN